jgi:hypothetical protein
MASPAEPTGERTAARTAETGVTEPHADLRGLREQFRRYLETLQDDRRHLLEAPGRRRRPEGRGDIAPADCL